jgi:hypothetical protein
MFWPPRRPAWLTNETVLDSKLWVQRSWQQTRRASGKVFNEASSLALQPMVMVYKVAHSCLLQVSARQYSASQSAKHLMTRAVVTLFMHQNTAMILIDHPMLLYCACPS